MADHDDDGHGAAPASSSLRTADAAEWESEFGVVVDSVAKAHQLAQYVADERAATSIRSYEPELIPGLLQVPDYIRAVTRIYFPDVSPDELSQLVDSRVARTTLLDHSDAPQFSVLLGEGALRREWDPPAARRAQLDALLHDLNGKRSNVHLRIVPMRLGLPDAMHGASVVMDLRDGTEVLWREGRYGSDRSLRQAEIRGVARSLERLTAAAYEQPAAEDLIKEIRESLG